MTGQVAEHASIGEAAKIPVSTATPVLTMSPVILQVPGRLVDMQVKVSVPVTGNNLPIILLSHGQGHTNNISSLNGYAPLTNFWASHGFAVLQPTHLSSGSLKFEGTHKEAPLFWRSRVEDLSHIIDQRENIEAEFAAIKGRLDWSRIAVFGHSMGGHTAEMVLGARLLDHQNESVEVNLLEPRIKAGVLVGAPGSDEGGAHLVPFTKQVAPFFADLTFKDMTTPTLVIIGDEDDPHYLTSRGVDWHADPYTMAKGSKSLLTMFQTKHMFGGISGYDADETDGESVEKVGFVQRLTWAYLRSMLYPEDDAWTKACAALEGLPTVGKIESKE